MTTTHLSPVRAARTWPVLPVAAAAGVLLGVGDLALQQALPYPYAELANTSGAWAVAAFAIGAWVANAREARWAGVVVLAVAVEAYYAAGILDGISSRTMLLAPSTVDWLGYAVVSGAAFGTAGAWSRLPRGWRPVLAPALAGGVLVGEGVLTIGQGYQNGAGGLTIGLGLLVVLATTLPARRAGRTLAALALTAPMALVCLVGFTAFGFAG